MGLFNEMDKRVKRFGVLDLKLLQLCSAFLILIVVKLIPDILNVSMLWLIILVVVCAVRPLYIFFREKD